MKPRRFVGRKFKLNNPELEKEGYPAILQVHSMIPDPADRMIYLTAQESSIDVLYTAPGKDVIIGSINYVDLLDKYTAIIPDYVITYHRIKMENMLNPEGMYDMIITVNRTYSNQALVFSLFNYMLETSKSNAKFISNYDHSLRQTTYSKIETVTNPAFSEEHALIIPWLYNDNREVTDVISCYYTDHFPLGKKSPNFEYYLLGNQNKPDRYKKYGWTDSDINRLNHDSHIYKTLSILILQYLNVYTLGEFFKWSCVGDAYKNISSEEFMEKFKDKDTVHFHALVDYLDRYIKLHNVYEGMPAIYPFNRINPNSIHFIKYTNEIDYHRLLEQFYKVGRYIIKMYFIRSQDILMITYTLLPNSFSSDDQPLTKDEIHKFLSDKK